MKKKIFKAVILALGVVFSCDQVDSLLDPYEPPVIDNIIASDREVSPGDTVAITVEATNPEEGLLFYEWSSSPENGRFVLPADQPTAQWIAPLKGGLYKINVRVSNEQEHSDAHVDIEVQSTQRPIINITEPLNGQHFIQYSRIEVESEAYHENQISKVWLLVDGTIIDSSGFLSTDKYNFDFVADSTMIGPTEIRIRAEAGQSAIIGEEAITVFIDGILPGRSEE